MEYRRAYPLSRHDHNNPSVHDRTIDDEAGNAHQRRRVAVACARCRKRKIRCSGDPGDGSGCQNCRAAGVDVRDCRFTRVGSAEVPLAGLGHHQHGFVSTPNLPLNSRSASWSQYSRSFPDSHVEGDGYRRSYGGISAALHYHDGPLDVYNLSSETYPGQHSTAGGPHPAHSPVRHHNGMVEPRMGHTMRYHGGHAHSPPLGLSHPPMANTPLPRSVDSLAENTSPYGLSALSLNPSTRQLPPPPASSRSYVPPLPMDDLARSGFGSQLDSLAAPLDLKHSRYITAWTEAPGRMHQTSYFSPSTPATPSCGHTFHPTTLDGAPLACSALRNSPDISPSSTPALTLSRNSTETLATVRRGISAVPTYSNAHSEIPAERADASHDLYTLAGTEPSSDRISSGLLGIEDSCNAALINGQRYAPTPHPRPHPVASYETLRHDSAAALGTQREANSYAEATTTCGY